MNPPNEFLPGLFFLAVFVLLMILPIYIFCRKISDAAKERQRHGASWGTLYAFLYILCGVVGSVLGAIIARENGALIGTYVGGFLLAFATYFVLKSIIRLLPLGKELPLVPHARVASGQPIAFSCLRCGASLTALSSQRGRTIQCSACKKATKVS